MLFSEIPATATGGLPLTGSERNATIVARTVNIFVLFLSSSPSAKGFQHFFRKLKENDFLDKLYHVSELNIKDIMTCTTDEYIKRIFIFK